MDMIVCHDCTARHLHFWCCMCENKGGCNCAQVRPPDEDDEEEEEW